MHPSSSLHPVHGPATAFGALDFNLTFLDISIKKPLIASPTMPFN